MNTQVFIVGGYVPTHSDEPTDLAYGNLGVFAYGSTDLKMQNAITVDETEKLFLAIGRKNGMVEIGRDINIPVKERNFAFKKFPFTPAVKAVTRVSIDGLGQNNFDEWSLTIGAKFVADDSGMEDNIRTVWVNGKFSSALELYTAFAEKVNEEANPLVRLVNAVPTNAGLELTAIYNGQTVDAHFLYQAFDEKCVNQCVQYKPCSEKIVLPQLGSGYVEHIKHMAFRYSTWKGTSFSDDIFIKDPSRDIELFSTENDVYQLKWSNTGQPDEDNSEVYNVYQEILLVVPTSVDISAAIQNIEDLIGKKCKLSPVL